MAGRLVLYLSCLYCIGGARGDIGDIDCESQDNRSWFTHQYCGFRHSLDSKLEEKLASLYVSNFCGWSLIFFYHSVMFAWAYAFRARARVAAGLAEEDAVGVRGSDGQVRQGKVVGWVPANRGYMVALEGGGRGFVPLDRLLVPFQRLLEDNYMHDIANICRRLGLNLLVYWAYFGESHDLGREHLHSLGLSQACRVFGVEANNPFIHSMWLTFLDNTVIWSARHAVEAYLFGATNEEVKVDKMWNLKTVYALPGYAGIKVLLIWASQTVLFLLYVLVMNDKSKVIQALGVGLRNEHHHTLTWILGVLLICTVGEKATGDGFSLAPWEAVYNVIKEERHFCRRAARNLPVVGRLFGAWTANSVYRQMLLNTTAILLSTEGPLDFIKDVLAIAFISTLDDADDDDKETGIEFMKRFFRACGRNEMVRESGTGLKNREAIRKLNDRLARVFKDGAEEQEWKKFLDKVSPQEASMLWLSTFESGNVYACLAFGADCRYCLKSAGCLCSATRPAHPRERPENPDSDYHELP
ncbi:unnamed protein product [Prorocentrum cordatum]|uniref:Uncharacterized protein n=1 Tax=Prorocentrum cordatum TaxID=2364126 RepID=A0ABN9VB67_9DINO|nr:unnamed protein product [Polarella glacialis]